MSLEFLPAAMPLPAETVRRLRDELGENTATYCAHAADLLRYWPAAHAPVATAAELRTQIAALHDAAAVLAPLLEPERFPFLVREALFAQGVCDPGGFVEDLRAGLERVDDAAQSAFMGLPKPRRGKPARPTQTGRDWIEAQLLRVHSAVTGGAETSTAAATCAAIVLEAMTLPVGDAEAMQRRDRRRRKRLRSQTPA